MATEDFIKTLIAAFIITFSWTIAASAIAGESRMTGTVWLWSETAPLSGEAAEALGNGNFVRGIRLANAALDQADSDRDRVIAHHNLCIIHAARGRIEAADAHCEAVRQMSQETYVISPTYSAAEFEGSELAYSPMITAMDVLETNLHRIGVPHLRKARATN